MQVNPVGTPLNQVFYSGVVTLTTASQGGVAGLLNPVNTPQFLWDCGTAYNFASMTTVITGAPASDTIILEGTLDGSNWTTLATSTSTTGDTQFTTGAVPFSALRARCTALSGGTAPTISVVAVAYQMDPIGSAVDSIPVSPYAPLAANVLDGSATAANTAAAQTILTIPTGRTWSGNLSITMTNQAATGTLVSANINTAGTGVTPAAAINLLTTQAGTVGGVAGDATNTNFISDVYVIAPSGNAVTLTLTNSSGTTCTSSANAVGVLL